MYTYTLVLRELIKMTGSGHRTSPIGIYVYVTNTSSGQRIYRDSL